MIRKSFVILMLAVVLALCGCGRPTTTSPENVTGSEAQGVGSAEQGSPAAAQEADFAQARISYLGPEGTYTQEAAELFFGGQGTYLPKDDVGASVQALLDGEADYAVIPQENAIGGPVVEYLDEVISHDGVCVVGEVELPINQNLLVRPGTQLADIRVVYSHKQGIAQGSAWLAENLPDAEVVEVSSTAEGARMVAEAEGGDCAAIGSAAAAQVYGLEVAAEAIQMSDANKTRFYVLSLGEPGREERARMAFLATGPASGLPDLLESVEDAGLSVVAVHDRPARTELGIYVYLIECSGGGYDAFERVASDEVYELRFLGSYDLV